MTQQYLWQPSKKIRHQWEHCIECQIIELDLDLYNRKLQSTQISDPNIYRYPQDILENLRKMMTLRSLPSNELMIN